MYSIGYDAVGWVGYGKDLYANHYNAYFPDMYANRSNADCKGSDAYRDCNAHHRIHIR